MSRSRSRMLTGRGGRILVRFMPRHLRENRTNSYCYRFVAIIGMAAQKINTIFLFFRTRTSPAEDGRGCNQKGLEPQGREGRVVVFCARAPTKPNLLRHLALIS